MATSDQIKSLLVDVNQASEGAISESSSYDARRKLLLATKKLSAALEEPEEAAWRFALAPTGHACGIIAWECGLFKQWPKETMTIKELSDMVKADETLLVRIMRALEVYDIFEEVEDEVYKHTPLSLDLSTFPLSKRTSGLSKSIRELGQLPEYFEKYGLTNPGDNPDNPSVFQFIYKTEKSYFEWLTTNPDPEPLRLFNEMMARSILPGAEHAGKNFLANFPFEKELADCPPDEVAVVDVGGGYGHLLKAVRNQLPGVKGKLVLEDLPETVAAAGHIGENIDVQPYNFLKDVQPVKGARFYILRHVIHDWPDHVSQKILENIIPALVKEKKSRILLIEIVLNNANASAWGSLMDINMMKFGGSGRKERGWRKIAESAGLKMTKVWNGPDTDSIMECIPKDWVE